MGIDGMNTSSWSSRPVNEMTTTTLVLRMWLFVHMCADRVRINGSESDSYKEVSEVFQETLNELDTRSIEDITAGWVTGIEIGFIDPVKARKILDLMIAREKGGGR